MKSLLIFSSLILSAWISHADIIIKHNQKSYEIEVSTCVEHWGMGESTTDLFLAYLSTNEYQKCHQFEVDENAVMTKLGATGDSCFYYKIPLGRKRHFGKKVYFNNKFILETADIKTDFSQIREIYPYDQCDPNYYNYMGSDLPFIDVENRSLFAVSQVIYEESCDNLDYAKRCYEFVAKHFDYGQPESGFKSLNYTLMNRKGDCGNLSSVFVTLLRMQDIPARHLMGFRPDGTLHVWADFYLANYGWIPVDVTYKHDYPSGDYFGNIKFEHNGFIVQRGIAHQIDVLEKPKRITGLQTYTYQVAYTKEHNAKVYIQRKVNCIQKI